METKKKIGFFRSMLSDDSGVSVSSKRVIGFIGFLILLQIIASDDKIRSSRKLIQLVGEKISCGGT